MPRTYRRLKINCTTLCPPPPPQPPKLETFPLPPPGASTPATTQEILAAKGESLWSRMFGNFAEMTTSTPIRDLLHATNLRRRYFPSEGTRAEDFFALKIPDGFGRV